MNPLLLFLLARRRSRRAILWSVLLTVAVPVLLIGVPLVALMVLVGATSHSVAATPGPGCPIDGPGESEISVDGLTSEQLTNAEIIVQAGRRANIPEYGWVIAIATALQESTLRNLDYGDRDSFGLFQQRPSSGWGTPGQIRDPEFASLAFYGGATSPHWIAPADRAEPPGLADISGWQSMTVTEAAQAVQRSAYPNAYAKHEALARAVVVEITGSTGLDQCGDGTGMTCPATELPAEEGLTPDGIRVLRCMALEFPEIQTYGGVGDRPDNSESDHQTGRAVDAMIPLWDTPSGVILGWKVAEWVRDNAQALGVSYVIFGAKIWSVARDAEGWRPYEHPSGKTDAVSLHLDHVHVSVYGNASGDDDNSELGTVVLPIDEGAYRLTAGFGDCGNLWSSCHTGLDFAAPLGTAVRAVAAGRVVSAAYAGAFGFTVKIEHGEGTVTWYCHLDPDSDARPDQTVEAGEPIAHVGVTGNTTGPHLHLEVRPDGGAPVDPAGWLSGRGVDP